MASGTPGSFMDGSIDGLNPRLRSEISNAKSCYGRRRAATYSAAGN